MTGNKNKRQAREFRSAEMRAYGIKVMMIPLMLGCMSGLLPSAHAEDMLDGNHGTLYVQGSLTESACRLEMESAYQAVDLGDTGTGRLQQVGSRGEPVRVELRLTDCLRSPIGSRDVRTGAMTWARDQPVVSVSFSATRDADNPQLVKAQGVSGLGLRLKDDRGQDVRLGSRGKPLLLAPGQNSLSYTLAAERTPAALVAGSYRSAVDFQLSYD